MPQRLRDRRRWKTRQPQPRAVLIFTSRVGCNRTMMRFVGPRRRSFMTRIQVLLTATAIVSAMLVRPGTIRAGAINDADYTTQIQAADVLARFLTDLNNRADARYLAITSFLREAGASREFTQHKAP